MKKRIPNTITLLNLLCGCISCIYVLEDKLITGTILIFIGAVLDFFDGMAARLLGVSGPLGLQLDSLADVVSFGLAPGLMVYQCILVNVGVDSYLPYIGLLIPLFSAYRLAKFNIDESQTTYFKGLPTPANAFMILGLVMSIRYSDQTLITPIISSSIFWVVFAPLSCIAMNIPTPLFSLKFKNFDYRDNRLRYLFMVWSVSLMIAFRFLGLSMAILSYILVSILMRKSISQSQS